MIVLAHLEHGHGAGQILRFGPLLPVVLVAVAAAMTRGADGATRLRRSGAIALAAAGLLHVGLTPEHFKESGTAGTFFVVSSAAELLVAAALWARRSRAATSATAAI